MCRLVVPTISSKRTEALRQTQKCGEGKGARILPTGKISHEAMRPLAHDILTIPAWESDDLGIKTLATGTNTHYRMYHIDGFKGGKWYNKQLDTIRAKRDRCKKGSRRYRHLSQVYSRLSQQKRNKQKDCLHKASHLIAHKLVERTVNLLKDM